MDASTSAVVLIEFQNDFTTEGGALHGAVADVMEATGDAREHAGGRSPRRGPRAPRSSTRRSSSPRATTRSRATPTGSSRASSTPTPSSRARGAPRSSSDVAPEEGDIVLEGKRGLDAFASTNLDFILRSKGIRPSRWAAS